MNFDGVITALERVEIMVSPAYAEKIRDGIDALKNRREAARLTERASLSGLNEMAELSRANGVPVRDITVKVNVTPDEYFALCHLADSDGRSQSSFMRQLLRERIVDEAHSASEADIESVPNIGQKRA